MHALQDPRGMVKATLLEVQSRSGLKHPATMLANVATLDGRGLDPATQRLATRGAVARERDIGR